MSGPGFIAALVDWRPDPAWLWSRPDTAARSGQSGPQRLAAVLTAVFMAVADQVEWRHGGELESGRALVAAMIAFRPRVRLVPCVEGGTVDVHWHTLHAVISARVLDLAYAGPIDVVLLDDLDDIDPAAEP